MHQKCRECSRAILDPFAARAYLRGSVALWYLFPGHDLSEGLGTFAGVCLPRRPGPGQLWARRFPVQVSVLQVQSASHPQDWGLCSTAESGPLPQTHLISLRDGAQKTSSLVVSW